MKKSKELKRTSDIDKEVIDQARETNKKIKEGERKARNVERLNKATSDLIGNLPKDEQKRLKQEMDRAYHEGARDFNKTKQEMERHLRDEDASRKEFGKAEKNTGADSRKVKQAEREVKKAPFSRELKKMAQNLDRVGDEFKKAGKTMDNDMRKGKREIKQETQRVRRAKPKMKF
jgi:hypothetical protein